jgi:hypothetical protein
MLANERNKSLLVRRKGKGKTSWFEEARVYEQARNGQIDHINRGKYV